MKIVKDALIMTAITVVFGLLLGLVYEITKEPIAQANYNAQQEAYRNVFTEAESFVEYEGFDEAAAEAVVADSGYPDNTIEGVVVVQDGSGAALGYVVTVTSHAGYGGDITFSVGITNEGVVNGYSITAISETAGLGMKANESDFYSQFEEKAVESLEVVKGTATADNQIEAISGATITSRAVTNGVNVSLAYFRTIEGGSANE